MSDLILAIIYNPACPHGRAGRCCASSKELANGFVLPCYVPRHTLLYTPSLSFFFFLKGIAAMLKLEDASPDCLDK